MKRKPYTNTYFGNFPFSAKFSEDEIQLIESQIRQRGLKKGQYAREALLAYSKMLDEDH